ncbi:hypothetical protein [Candidatus Magnetominusculus xianensis]|uniref:Transposase (Putative), YhgA-like protein n=1 Tax=Candidatus Magnetominusculus xianensis TaxID=1748249 RepID=A0ABR5SH69_9BACT|nr:hypothetical protein [Candidatus Magnetominusculus xianensis]KWT91026.1 hypothetical protein ASN18_0973 [Candidatus Magnetominusculus xianensis]MBF0402581.1 hypothetical protein [Nitrospirota bacterium]
MRQKYDITLKKLLKDIPTAFLKILTGFETGRFLDVTLVDIQYRKPDLIIELPDGSILHIEIQSTSDPTMLKRMCLYWALIFNQHDRLPRQIVLYVGRKPHQMKNAIGPYSYEILNIRDINCSDLLKSDKPEDAVLSLLCSSDDMDSVIAQILEKLSVLPPKTMNDYIIKLLNLADLRKLSKKIYEEVEKMPITIDARKTWLFKEGLKDGKREGLSEGKREGLFEGIELGLELKYGAAGLELMPLVRGVTTIDKLEAFKNLIKKAKTVDELKGFFETSGV